MSLEKIISSKIRRKIIRVLSKLSETNIMDLVRRANSTYNQIIPHLTLLEKEGIVSEQRFGRVRIIKLETNNEKTQTLLRALKILCDEQKPSKINPILPSSKNNNE
jgi:DNA-binding transcriptional ArsR family regulator